MKDNTLAARLKTIREAKGLTKYRLAKLSGISQTYIYRLELGEIKNPRRDTLQALSEGLNITLAQLVGETAPIDTWQLVEQSLKAYIPVYAGLYEVGMEPIDYVVSTRARIPPDTLRGYRIEGLFLEPEIRDGDTLIVDSAIMPVNGDLVLAEIGNEIAIERYSKDGEGHESLTDNVGSYQLGDVRVFGVITEYVRRLRQM